MIFTTLLFGGRAVAQETLRFDQRYVESIKKSSGITPVAIDSFGDQTDLATGSVQFRWTDIDIPGNNALPVRLQRALSIEDKLHGDGQLEGFGAVGRLDIPYLKGVFSTNGWQVTGASPNARCSMPSAPPSLAGGKLQAADYWSGNWMHIPWEGEQAMLMSPAASIPRPSGSAQLTTKNFWAFTCLPSTKNGYPGEGFVALSPKGEKYYFDWVVTKPYGALTKRVGNYGDGQTGGMVASTPRQVVFFLVTRIEDRFGNWVNYQYSGSNLTSISASDGRSITLSWSNGRIVSAASSVGSWNYAYADNSLTATQPDGSRWTYVATGLLEVEPTPSMPVYDPTPRCPLPDRSTGSYTLAVTQPSGATATFQFEVQRHFKSNVPEMCNSYIDGAMLSYKYLTVPNFNDTLTLVSKTVTGLALQPMQWLYTYTGSGFRAFEDVCANPPTPLACPRTKTTEVRGPDRSYKRYTFGNMFNLDSGQLLSVDEGSESGVEPNVQLNILKTTTNEYVTAEQVSAQPFPDCVGTPGSWQFEPVVSGCLRPLRKSVIGLDGATFNAETTGFDLRARPLAVRKYSSLGYTKVDSTTYHDSTAPWVLGQIAKTQTTDAEGKVYTVSETAFDPVTALPTQYSRFGKPVQTISYNLTTGSQDGTVATVKDGKGQTTKVENWNRGIPQKITFADGTFISAVVPATGWIASVTDEVGAKTCYDYDPMGRVKKITYPSETQTGVCDTSAWAATTTTFAAGNPAAYGVPAGHWRQTTLTGNARKIVIFDALWRPVVEQTLDLGNVAGTTSEIIKRYDPSGRMAFESYPMNTGGQAVYTNTALKGSRPSYDALDRVIKVDRDSELGVLTTRTEYRTGFQTNVTDANTNSTLTTLYQAYDQPTHDYPRGINHPESTFTEIYRDVFGKPTALVRRNAAGSIKATRHYVYNTAQELCKAIEPETGSTLQHYDAAGNLDWSATGLALPSLTSCDESDASIAARRTTRNYDARNRLLSIQFADHGSDTTNTYTPTGQLATITAANYGTTPVTTTYTYNNRGLLESESIAFDTTQWGNLYSYNANGHLSSRNIAGLVYALSPNALGQPTQVGDVATNISYYPNGAPKQFTYGNGIVHTLTQNARQLPERSRDAYGATATLDDGYDYDPNGNVRAISDGATGRGQRGNRDMIYDGLDRLRDVASPMFGSAGFQYTYDALDNLTQVVASGRNHSYCYDANWRLTNIKTGGCTGSTVTGLGYDVQGNVINKNGTVGGLYTFDMGNRLRQAQLGSLSTYYIYDGHGRRVRDYNTASKYSFYDLGGQLVYARDLRKNTQAWYLYLGSSLVAIREHNVATGVSQYKYQHTDALGSPVAVTDQSRNVLARYEYEPYGGALGQGAKDEPCFTGHVCDAATGLIYMQQRYYDAALGKFLSVDPLTPLEGGRLHFNRYGYAYNNPYKFVDPDGRCPTGTLICPRPTLTSTVSRTLLPVEGKIDMSSTQHAWPVPGHTKINEADQPGEGRGEFGSSRNTARGRSTHTGVDIQAPGGSRVVAKQDGVVVAIEPNPSGTYGLQVVIDHGDGTFSQYAHLSQTLVEPGHRVSGGQDIGTVGRTGNTPSLGDSHLHLEIRLNGPAPRAAGGTVTDPLPYLEE